VTVTGVPGANITGLNFYTYDGIYQAYLPTGNFKFTISAPGYSPQSWTVSVSPGQTGTGQNVYLEQSNIPVPEFSTIAIAAFASKLRAPTGARPFSFSNRKEEHSLDRNLAAAYPERFRV
jgi:hypothetical protein